MAKLDTRSRSILLSAGLWGTIVLSAYSCASDGHRALMPIELESSIDARKQTSVQVLGKMREILDDDPTLRPSVEDLLFLAEARAAEDQGKFAEAESYYLQTLRLDRSTAGSQAFEGWAELQAKLDIANGRNPDFLARKLLEATKGGEESPWLKRQKLTHSSALATRLKRLVGTIFEAAPTLSPPEALLPDPSSFSPRDDVFFEARAKALCKKPMNQAWISWLSTLSVAQRLYWNGLVLDCAGDPRKASADFLQAIASLSTEPEDTARVVRSAELLIHSLKAIGDRVGATEAYATQASVLKRNDLPLELLGWSVYEKQKRFIDSTYWVARNRALHGDYERARRAVEDGIEGLDLLRDLAKSSKEKAQISELQAEGLHVLASRIQYELGDWAGALATNQSALAVVGITKDWRHRLLWSEAWYQYRKGDKPLALAALDRFLQEEIEESSRSKALYWRGRTHWELGDKASAEADFQQLNRLAPLSFYAVVGVPAIDPDEAWSDDFAKADEDDLSRIEDFDWGSYKEAPEAMRRFHRLEFVLASRFAQPQAGLANELFQSIQANRKLLDEVEPSLYATRLMHMAEQYILSISLSARLNQQHSELWRDFPEQLLIFFPEAYRTDVQKFSAAQALEAELVWGLSRQESSFRKAVESPAGAIGLMQLMPNTAQELARANGISPSGMRSRLKESDLNLQLGTLYLANLGKRYQGKWPRAIAAYNAGEYVVDAWMLRRDDPDLIVWAEGLSFGETSSYVKNVWRNWEVYRWLGQRR